MAKLITFIVPCKGRLAHLKQCLASLVQQEKSEVIVVDSNCPDGTAEWVTQNHPLVKVVKHNDQGIFNRSISRNIGARNANTEWISFIDADVVLSGNFYSFFEDKIHIQDSFFIFERTPELVGAFGCSVVPQESFHSIGGYDEIFQDWGEEDDDLFFRLEFSGLHPRQLSHNAVDYIVPHGEGQRTGFHAEKNKTISQVRNILYRKAKEQLIFLMQNPNLDPGIRKCIYRDSRATVSTALLSPRGRATLSLSIPTREEWLQRIITKSILNIEIDASIARRSLRRSSRVFLLVLAFSWPINKLILFFRWLPRKQ